MSSASRTSLATAFGFFAVLTLAQCSESGSISRPMPENTPTACSDGIDNDADGDIDCGDADCSGSVSCGDGGVDTLKDAAGKGESSDDFPPDSHHPSDANSPDASDSAPVPSDSAPVPPDSTPVPPDAASPYPLPTWSTNPSKIVVVAAKDTDPQAKSGAKYVCSAANDQAVIQKAINEVAAAGTAGGKVVLLKGNFYCSNSIVPSSHTTLEGQGPDDTLIHQTGIDKAIRVTKPDVVLRKFGMRKNMFIEIRADRIKVHEVTGKGLFSGGVWGHAAFYVPMFLGNRNDIEFVDCKALGCAGHGFSLAGWWDGSANKSYTLRDAKLIRCDAIGNGDGTRDWSVGFDIQEQGHVERMLLKDCKAIDNWEAGFYQEPNFDDPSGLFKMTTRKLVLDNCIAEKNGKRKRAKVGLCDIYTNGTLEAGLRHGAGFFIHTGAKLVSCKARDNEIAGFFHWDTNWPFADHHLTLNNCNDTGSTFSYGKRGSFDRVKYVNCTGNGKRYAASDVPTILSVP